MHNLTIDEGNPKSLVANAYAARRDGKFAEAERIAGEVLEREDASPKQQADSWCILGTIGSVTGEPEHTLYGLDEARNIYLELGNDLGIFSAHTQNAMSYYALKDFPKAEEQLQEARIYYNRAEHENKKVYLIPWYDLAYKVALAMGDKELALQYTKDRLENLPPGATFEKAMGLSIQAFALCINGQIEMAKIAMNLARDLFGDDPYSLNFPGSTEILTKRAKGEPYAELAAKIESYADENNLPELKQALEVAQTWQLDHCPSLENQNKTNPKGSQKNRDLSSEWGNF